MCDLCPIGESDNLPAIVGEEDEEFNFENFMKMIEKVRTLREDAVSGVSCRDTEGRCATHNRISGVWEDYGTWEVEEGYRLASTYSGNSAVQTFMTPDSGGYATILAALSNETDSISEVLNHPQDKDVIYHPGEITDWDEIVTRHHLIAADFRQQIEAGEALRIKLESRNYS